MPRAAPITGKADVPAEHHAVVDGVLKTFGRVRGPFSMLLHSPQLAQHFLGIVNFMRDSSIVEQKDRSLAALVAAGEREAGYVWAAQVATARKAGVRDAAIELIRAKGDPAALPAGEREVVAYAQQLVRTGKVDRATFDALHQAHGTKWLLELTAAIGYFGSIAGVVNAFDVPVPDDGEKVRR